MVHITQCVYQFNFFIYNKSYYNKIDLKIDSLLFHIIHLKKCEVYFKMYHSIETRKFLIMKTNFVVDINLINTFYTGSNILSYIIYHYNQIKNRFQQILGKFLFYIFLIFGWYIKCTNLCEKIKIENLQLISHYCW